MILFTRISLKILFTNVNAFLKNQPKFLTGVIFFCLSLACYEKSF
jgi:hypothetical protein